MKELNFSNASIVTNDSTLVFENRIKENEDIKVDSTAILLKELETSKDITANYSLIAFESLIAKDITVKNDLVCYKDIECETLNVYGNFKCYGNLHVKNMNVQEDVVINTAFINSAKLGKNLIAYGSIEVIESLDVGGSVICNEGIIGEGKITCEYIYAHDYLEIEVASGDIKKNEANRYDKLLLKLQDSKNMRDFINSIEYKEALKNIELIIDEIQQIIPSLDTDYDDQEIIDIFKQLTLLSGNFKSDYRALKFIDEIQDSNDIDDLFTFLKLVNYEKNLPTYMMGLNTCGYVFNHFLESQRRKIDNMSVDNIKTNADFAKALTLLENNRDYFENTECETILQKLYSKIGVSLKLVSKNIDMSL